MKIYTISSTIILMIIIAVQSYYYSQQIQNIKADNQNIYQTLQNKIENAINNNNIVLDKKMSTISQKVDEFAKSVYDLNNDAVTKPDTVLEKIPVYEITVDDNHVVARNEGSGKTESLTWVVIYNGKIVIEQVAGDKPAFLYSQTDAGTYTVYLKAFFDGGFRTVSNVVSYVIAQSEEKTGA